MTHLKIGSFCTFTVTLLHLRLLLPDGLLVHRVSEVVLSMFNSRTLHKMLSETLIKFLHDWKITVSLFVLVC